MPRVEIHYANDWAALYVDGTLADDGVGDTYRVEEQAFSVLGVKQVHDESFMRGQNRREGVAQTLDQVDEYRWARDNRAAEVKRLRDEAAEILARAEALEVGRG